jgi:hypothetical protein
MTTKLTLTIKKEIALRAKSYAKEKDLGLSEIVENYLDSLTQGRAEKASSKIKKPKQNTAISTKAGQQRKLRSTLGEQHIQKGTH